MRWSVPVAVADVPESGRHFDLEADAAARAAVAELAGLSALPRLHASFDVMLHGREGLHVTGRVSATVDQTCVVTLEPIENEVVEPIDIVFTPAALPSLEVGTDIDVPPEDGPEPLEGGAVDLGALATEFLLLGIDPYPRKPGAVFEPPASGGAAEAPFAELTALQRRRRQRQGDQD
jgi:hypothetical protein